jgi:hypothetical protein
MGQPSVNYLLPLKVGCYLVQGEELGKWKQNVGILLQVHGGMGSWLG